MKAAKNQLIVAYDTNLEAKPERQGRYSLTPSAIKKKLVLAIKPRMR